MSQEKFDVSSPEVHPSVVLLPSRQMPAVRVHTFRVDVADPSTDPAGVVPSWFSVSGGQIVSVVAAHGSFRGVEQVLRLTLQAADASPAEEVVLLAATVDDESSLVSWLRRFGVSEDELAARYRVVHVARPSDIAEAVWVLSQRGEKVAAVTLLDFGAVDVADGDSRNAVMMRLSEVLLTVARGDHKPVVLVESKGRRGLATDQDPTPGLRPHSLLVQNSSFVFEVDGEAGSAAVRVIKARTAIQAIGS